MGFNDILRQMVYARSNVTAANVDSYLAAERRAGADIRESIKSQMRTLKDMKKLEKKYRKADKILEKSVNKKANIEMRYEVMMRNAAKAGDQASANALKRKMYHKLAKKSLATYSKLSRILNKISALPNMEKSFEQTNEKIRQEMTSLASGIRQEALSEEKAE